MNKNNDDCNITNSNYQTFYLVVNGKILASRNDKYEDKNFNPIENLLDILYEKYPIIDLYNYSTIENKEICWFNSTRENTWDYINIHEGRINFVTGDPKDHKTGKDLDILIFDEGYSYDLDENYENDKVLIEYIKNNFDSLNDLKRTLI